MAARGRHEGAEDVLRRDIQAERAAALGRAFEALETALEELRRFDAGPRSATGARRWRERRADLLANAAERLWYVVIHREAIGVTRHEVVFEVLRVLSEVCARMGPRRRTAPRRTT